MNKKKVEQIPSETALFAALRRTIANKEYNNNKLGPDYLAEIFLPAYYRFFLKFEKVRKNTKNKLAGFMPGLTEYIIARTAFFDGLFINAIKNQIPQIVLLGAGYDSRAYRFAKSNKGTIIYELDAIPTQKRKIKCLKAAHVIIPIEIQYVPINFINESLSNVLEKAGYKNQERTLFLWEGVSFYLDLESVKETLSFVGRSSHRDSVIAYDYTISISEENMNKYYGANEFKKSMKEHHANEALVFSIKNGEIESFLAERDLRMIDYLDNEAIERKYLMDENGSLIGRMTGIFRFVCASPLK
jgi:methyltransferase (TIGR00027 family)